MGKAALEGRLGILKVESGWQGWYEVNRIIYDSRQVTVEQMVEWLKKTGTFIKTIKPIVPE